MTKKLLVPLFAISMAAFGCGSDSSPAADAGKDSAADVVTTPDGSKTDTNVTPVDGGADTSPDAVGDTATPVVDAPVVTDAGSDSSISNDAAPIKTDGGADAGSDAGDAGSDASKG